jgi:hypothetical protein
VLPSLLRLILRLILRLNIGIASAIGPDLGSTAWFVDTVFMYSIVLAPLSQAGNAFCAILFVYLLSGYTGRNPIMIPSWHFAVK